MSEVLGNIILVGEVGANKSSIINMIAGTMMAQTSKGAGDRGTFESMPTLSPALMVESAT